MALRPLLHASSVPSPRTFPSDPGLCWHWSLGARAGKFSSPSSLIIIRPIPASPITGVPSHVFAPFTGPFTSTPENRLCAVLISPIIGRLPRSRPSCRTTRCSRPPAWHSPAFFRPPEYLLSPPLLTRSTHTSLRLSRKSVPSGLPAGIPSSATASSQTRVLYTSALDAAQSRPKPRVLLRQAPQVPRLLYGPLRHTSGGSGLNPHPPSQSSTFSVGLATCQISPTNRGSLASPRSRCSDTCAVSLKTKPQGLMVSPSRPSSTSPSQACSSCASSIPRWNPRGAGPRSCVTLLLQCSLRKVRTHLMIAGP